MTQAGAKRLTAAWRRALWLCALAGAAAACEDTSPSVPCVDAPPGGCPADNGADVCEDSSCSAVYTCQAGRWVFDHACAARGDGGSDDGALHRDASGSDAPAVPADGAAPADGATPPVDGGEVDAPPGAFGGPGCIALQPPDCPLGVGLACGGGASCCGCAQFFVCADGGWSAWGDCVDGGLVSSPP